MRGTDVSYIYTFKCGQRYRDQTKECHYRARDQTRLTMRCARAIMHGKPSRGGWTKPAVTHSPFDDLIIGILALNCDCKFVALTVVLLAAGCAESLYR